MEAADSYGSLDLKKLSPAEWESIYSNRLFPILTGESATNNFSKIAKWLETAQALPLNHQGRKVSELHKLFLHGDRVLGIVPGIPAIEVDPHSGERYPGYTLTGTRYVPEPTHPYFEEVDTEVYPGLVYYRQNGRLVVIGDDHNGATHFKLARQLGYFPEGSGLTGVNVDRHTDTIANINDDRPLTNIAANEYRIWESILTLSGLFKEIVHQEAEDQPQANNPDAVFIDLDAIIPARYGARSLSRLSWLLDKLITHKTKLVSVAVSSSRYTDQDKAPEVIDSIGKVIETKE